MDLLERLVSETGVEFEGTEFIPALQAEINDAVTTENLAVCKRFLEILKEFAAGLQEVAPEFIAQLFRIQDNDTLGHSLQSDVKHAKDAIMKVARNL